MAARSRPEDGRNRTTWAASLARAPLTSCFGDARRVIYASPATRMGRDGRRSALAGSLAVVGGRQAQ